jgi:hypothetical protein
VDSPKKMRGFRPDSRLERGAPLSRAARLAEPSLQVDGEPPPAAARDPYACQKRSRNLRAQCLVAVGRGRLAGYCRPVLRLQSVSKNCGLATMAPHTLRKPSRSESVLAPSANEAPTKHYSYSFFPLLNIGLLGSQPKHARTQHRTRPIAARMALDGPPCRGAVARADWPSSTQILTI